MVEINVVRKTVSPFESKTTSAAALTSGPGAGDDPQELSRSARLLVATGRGGPVRSALESVIGTDERVRILDTDLPPWRMICALRMRSPSGGMAIGTGWFVGPRTVLTAGHCVYSTRFFGGWADTIEVIPGLAGAGPAETTRPYGSFTTSAMSSIDRWTKGEDPDFDIGCIHLSEPVGDQVGWFAVGVRPDADLPGYLVNVSGYPSDRGLGNEQYHSVNRLLRVTDRRIFYEVDTFGGQSGAPVWIHEAPDGPPIAVGVHAYGTGGGPSDLTANSATRIIPEVFDAVLGWIEADGGPPAAGNSIGTAPG